MKSSSERKRGRARGASTTKRDASRMSEDEKDRRRFARIERRELAAQLAVECRECGEAGKIFEGRRPAPALCTATVDRRE
jgi:hypothetical protein